MILELGKIVDKIQDMGFYPPCRASTYTNPQTNTALDHVEEKKNGYR